MTSDSRAPIAPSISIAPTHRLHLPSLDGARGIAILMVVLDHLSGEKIIPFQGFRGIGHIGVYLFFSLSAFLLTAPFWLKAQESMIRLETWGSYFWKRLLRIYPLYVLALVYRHFTVHNFRWAAVRDHLLLRRGDSIYWTMEIETKYYFILPLLILVFVVAWRRNRIVGALSTAVLVPVLLILSHVDHLYSLDGRTLHSLFPIFFLGSVSGSCLALMVSNPAWRRWPRWAGEAAAIGAFGASLSLAPGVLSLLPHRFTPSPTAETWLLGALWSIFLITHLHGVGFVKSILGWLPLRWLGLISYSLYLWHVPVVSLFRLFKLPSHVSVPWPMMVPVVAAAMVAVASLSYLFIERPLSRLKFAFAPARASRRT